MSTAKSTARKSVKLAIELAGKNVYLTPTGVRIGDKGKVLDPALFLATVPDKGIRRQIRKAARAIGRHDVAAARV